MCMIWRALSMVQFLSENFTGKEVFWVWVHSTPPRAPTGGKYHSHLDVSVNNRFIPILDCVFHETRWDGGSDGTAASYSISDEETAIFGYVGPWDTSQSNPITISVTPQPTTSTIDSTPGDGDDINIFITDDPDFVEFNTGFNFYGLCKYSLFFP